MNGAALRTEGKDKPPYRVPTLEEVRAVPPNGLKAISTFAGCGGSSTGLRMAGFELLWANEFIEETAASYRANWPDHPVDTRDVRVISGEEILEELGLRAGELDLVDGSPPCDSFSTCGKREKTWGGEKEYGGESHSKKVRQRTDDLFWEFGRLVKEIQPRAFVAENVEGMVIGKAKGYFKDVFAMLEGAGYKVVARLLDAQWLGVPQRRRRIIFVGTRLDLGLKPLFPEPLPYNYALRDVFPRIRRAMYDARGQFRRDNFVNKVCPTIYGNGAYHFKVDDEPEEQVPAEARMEGTAAGRELARLKPGESSDKYFNLVRAHPGAPCPTVTSAGARGAAAVAHPYGCRKFTIGELLAICGFPPDYHLEGLFRRQWEQLGKSVPPLMMKAIGEKVAEVLS